MANRPDDRIEREINEILDKIEEFPAPAERRARKQRRVLRQAGDAISERQHSVMRWLSRFNVSQVMLLAFLMILGSIFLRRANPALMQWVLIAGIALLVASFAVMVFGSGRPTAQQQYWRGRRIELRRESWLTRLRSRFRRR